MFEGQRLSAKNLGQYAGATYKLPKMIRDIPCLLQNDYGEAQDCTLTSITAIIKWLKPELDINNIYNKVEATAKRYGYTGNYGTPNVTIKMLYNNILKAFKINKKV